MEQETALELVPNWIRLPVPGTMDEESTTREQYHPWIGIGTHSTMEGP
jgi:hypothetical protein